MNAADFRRLALSLPEAMESTRMDHADFRVGGKIFATLGYPTVGWATVKLMPDQQAEFARAQPDAFVVVKGAGGRLGATNVRLKSAGNDSVREALEAVWQNTAPKNVAARFGGSLGRGVSSAIETRARIREGAS
jgi:hypothetical protein